MDDIHILIRKLLSTSSGPSRRQGIIGALAFLTQSSIDSGPRPDEEEETMMDSDAVSPLSLDERVLGEIKSIYQLCLEACSRDSTLLSFLMEETTRAVEKNKLHTQVVKNPSFNAYNESSLTIICSGTRLYL